MFDSELVEKSLDLARVELERLLRLDRFECLSEASSLNCVVLAVASAAVGACVFVSAHI